MTTKQRLMGLFVLFSLGACGLMGPKPHDVYHRKDVAVSDETKLIVFPAMDWSGSTASVDKGVDTAINGGWANLYGSTRVIPAGPVISEVSKRSGFRMLQLVKAMDNVGQVEQLLAKNKKFKKFVKLVTKKFGNYDFALALVDGNENRYDGKSQVKIHLGHFNTKTMTWKWITKVQDKKGWFGNWAASYNSMVSNSFDHAKDAWKEAEGRTPASEK